MRDASLRALLTSLRRTLSHRRLFGSDHQLSEAACAQMARAADGLVGTAQRAEITIVEDTIYLDGTPMAAVSLAFNSVIRGLEALDVESITFQAPVDPRDCAALADLAAGHGSGPGERSSITLNEGELSREEISRTPSDGVRSAYSTSLETLRAVGVSLRKGTAISLARSTSAVKGLLDQLVSQPGAAFLLSTVKSHHEYTFYHSVNTSILSLAMGRVAGLEEEDLIALGLGALLHDIGKIGVSASILQHPGRLTPSDWAEIKRHPQLGAEAILAAAEPGQERAAVVALEHHVRYDGKGYPGVADRHAHEGTQHFFSRLVAVTDTYDAITTRRAYRRSETPTRALSTLVTGAGASHDPDFVHAFIRMMGIFPPGTLLALTGGTVVMITRPARDPGARPVGVVVADSDGSRVASPEPVSFEPREIVRQLSPAHIGIDPAQLLDQLAEAELLAS